MRSYPSFDDGFVGFLLEEGVDVLDALHDAAGSEEETAATESVRPRPSSALAACLQITSSLTALALEPGVLNTCRQRCRAFQRGSRVIDCPTARVTVGGPLGQRSNRGEVLTGIPSSVSSSTGILLVLRGG